MIGGYLPLLIRAQNAALLINKRGESTVHVEAFELSPPNESVTTSLGRLRRSFPGPALALDLKIFKNAGFVESAAHTLAKMSHQPVADTKSKVKKEGRQHIEDRDTTHPKVVTELFIGFLRPMCEDADVSRICKNTREEVIWRNNRSPWRRSPLWLLVRVAMQLVLSRFSVEGNGSGELFKSFMVFFMSHVLKVLRGSLLSSEQFHVMNAKISRRLIKLNLPGKPSWLHFVQDVLESTGSDIIGRWSNTRAQMSLKLDMAPLTGLNTIEDVHCVLSSLDDYITSMSKERISGNDFKEFDPQPSLAEYDAAQLPDLRMLSNRDYSTYNLAAFGYWVAENLDHWLEDHIGDDSTCALLGCLMRDYHAVALNQSLGDPEAVSIMLLNILELWIACDKSATHIHALLRDYDPCVPMGLFQLLVLPFRSQMARLQRAEAYMRQRRGRVSYSGSGIFHDFGTPECFSVRYFDQSDEHQQLNIKIEDHAHDAREKKKRELRQQKSTYADLMDQYDRCECDTFEVIVSTEYNLRERQHSSSCTKCRLMRTMDSMRIDIHEWPLPAHSLKKKSTVFELKLPHSFGSWRDASIFFVVDILSSEYSSEERPRAQYALSEYHGLRTFFTNLNGSKRLGLLSQVKPHEGTHRKSKNIIETTEEDICLDNGLHFRYYDSDAACFISDIENTHHSAALCVYQLPPASSALQKFLFRPAEKHDGLWPNEVIASQHACPDHMSLEEYRAICTIPLGVEIQWKNILLQLSMPSVDFKKVETCIFICQTIYQAGPPQKKSILRKGHDIIREEVFSKVLLEKIMHAMERIKDNWESAAGVFAYICLTSRVLALSEGIHEMCLALLQNLQNATFRWVELIKEKVGNTVDDEPRRAMIARAVYLALICASAFDTEDKYLPRLLRQPRGAAIFIQCCMTIHEWKEPFDVVTNPLLPVLYTRWKTLCYRCHPILAQEIVHNKNPALETAIKKAWTAFQGGSSWSAVAGKSCCWLVSDFVHHGNGGGQLQMHFHLLTGEFLVNGLPLARLPRVYENHETYQRLFGHAAMEIMPSAVPGMQFSSKNAWMGYTLHLGLGKVAGCNSNDVCIRAEKEEQTLELLPPRLFMDKFPDALVNDFVHWYDMDRGYVEFRPLEEAWVSSNSNWRLATERHRDTWCLSKEEVSLISLASETAKFIAHILHEIESPAHIHCTSHRGSSFFAIDLPRLQLGFYRNPGSSFIECRQFGGMAIDVDQSLDSLVGLRNKLLLKHVNCHERIVLVPEGTITFQRNGEHVDVMVERQAVSRVFAYTVDSQLGRLVGNGSLQSKLTLCYLHALTSFCMPDPLTGQTGTEQALSIIRSAAVRSFEQLKPENTAILAEIAALTPERRYYPDNERAMQNIQWQANLGFLAQHGDFYAQVVEIFDQDLKMRLFYPDILFQHPSLPHVERSLLNRDLIRSSTFRISGFGAENHTITHDVVYTGLDHDQTSEQGTRAFKLSKMIYDGIPVAQKVPSGQLSSRLWSFFSKTTYIMGPDAPIDKAKARYDAALILEPSTFIAKSWCSIHHHLLSLGDRQLNRFQVMIWLSTMAFAKDADMTILETLASLYILSDTDLITPPSRPSFELHHGNDFDPSRLRSELQSALTPLHMAPESKLRPREHEKLKQFMNRQAWEYNKKKNDVLEVFILALGDQWPVLWPRNPTCDGYPQLRDYLDVENAMVKAMPLFEMWFDNRAFREYLDRLSKVVACQKACAVLVHPFQLPDMEPAVPQKRGYVDVDQLLDCSPPTLDFEIPELEGILSFFSLNANAAAPRLELLIDKLGSEATSGYEREYVNQLRGSVESLRNVRSGCRVVLSEMQLKEAFDNHLRLCYSYSRSIYQTMATLVTSARSKSEGSEAKEAMDAHIATLMRINQLPRVTPIFFLQQLTRHRWSKLTDGWKRLLVAYGLSITAVQRAERLVGLVSNREDLIRETQNRGHTNWDPLEFPESLLLEIESGILIRDVQEEIAQIMRKNEGGNSVMQLNMGEGKSSVIVPIVAAFNANGSCLARILVAKPQSRQMLQMLVAKIGGLVDRRVYYMPVFRGLKLGERESNEVERMCRECMLNGGVLLVQPEHVLSLKLMGLESFITENNVVGASILRTLELFRSCSRDVVDESDENFSVKFELVYTMGSQRPTELSPQRWLFIHQLLHLVRRVAPGVKKKFPLSIEVNYIRPGGFPKIQILHDDARQELFKSLLEYICDNGLDGLPISRQPEATRRAFYTYAFNTNLASQEIAAVENQGLMGFWTDATKGPLLLLRGLLAGGVLGFCLGQKRWRVNYGPDKIRKPLTRLAVPYRAKDNPAPRSEFSHPDVIIILTSLSYYYAGLSDSDLLLAFNHLLKSDQADMEYQVWVEDAPSLPRSYHQLAGINLEDGHQCTEYLFPSLRFSKNAIDYFLAHIVFPKEMKEFPEKLSASGWDIGEIKTHSTVGFSGTNDSRKTLPLSMNQLDLPEQNHTNAMVLECLLRPENSVTFCPPRDYTSGSDAQSVLDMVTNLKPPAQVILDVGAQILELSNFQVAQEWLALTPDGRVQAVVFFNDKDELYVLDRKGRAEPLQISPFAKQLESCYVFLDEAHTRGTDLKLPQHYRAAVTLGADLPKDKLVQGKVCLCNHHEANTNSSFSLYENEKTRQRTIGHFLHPAANQGQNSDTIEERR